MNTTRATKRHFWGLRPSSCGRAVGLAALLLSTLAVPSCVEEDPELGTASEYVGGVVDVTVDGWSPQRIGERTQLVAHAHNPDGSEIPNQTFTWTSSDPGVVEVTATGRALVKNTGSAVVTATTSGVSGTTTILPTDTDVIPRPDSDHMLTMWPPRGGEQPVILENGAMKILQDFYRPDEADNTKLRVCTGGTSASPCPGTDHEIDPDNLLPPWGAGSVEKLAWVGDRIAVLTDVDQNGAGTVRAMDRFEEWTRLATGDAKDVVLEGDRICILYADDRVRCKDGLHGSWVLLADGVNNKVSQVVLEFNRIGLVYSRYGGDDSKAGLVRVKDGLNSSWTLLADGVTAKASQLVLESNRIGLVYSRYGGDDSKAGLVRVKDDLNSSWTLLADGVTAKASQLVLEGNRIGLVYSRYGSDDAKAGLVRVKNGLNSSWTLLVDGVNDKAAKLVLENNRIGVLYGAPNEGKVRVKDGINGTWVLLVSSGATALELQEEFIGVQNAAGELLIKKGLWGQWKKSPKSHPGMTQWLLVADVPAKPWRTGIDLAAGTNQTNYTTKAKQCQLESGSEPGSGCYANMTPDTRWAHPINFYGWYCGADSVNSDILDPLDALCRHHDNGQGFYRYWGIDTGTYDTCVVSVGSRKLSLTDASGAPVAWTETSAENAGLHELWKELDHLQNWADSGCSPAERLNFEEATAARHNL